MLSGETFENGFHYSLTVMNVSLICIQHIGSLFTIVFVFISM